MEGPAGSTFDWDAVVNNEIENELIGWRSLPGSQVDIAGSVHFTDVADGTEIFVHLKYHPPAGELGITLVKLLGRDPHEEIKVGLERLKEFLESSNAPVPVTQAETEQKMG
jgi:uncharacterized membrane protein